MFYDFTNERTCKRKTIYFAPTFPVTRHKRSRRSRCTCIDALLAHKKGSIRVGTGVEKDFGSSTCFLQAAYRARRNSYVLQRFVLSVPYPSLILLFSFVQSSKSTVVVLHTQTEANSFMLIFNCVIK